MRQTYIGLAVGLIFVGILTRESLGNFEIPWHTLDSGGGTSIGGELTVSGAIGQPDAQPPPVMSGGPFQLTGGFWTAVAEPSCALPGDTNLDGYRDGADIQNFVDCLLGQGVANCACADLDGNGSVDAEDAPIFVMALLGS